MKNLLVLELLWISLIVVITAIVMFPMFQGLKEGFPFLWDNITLIVLSVLFTRLIFSRDRVLLFEKKWLKAIFILVPIPIMFYLIDLLYNFQVFTDEKGMFHLLKANDYESQYALTKYIKSEFIFFWTFTLISSVLIPFKMLKSLWRQYNKKF